MKYILFYLEKDCKQRLVVKDKKENLKGIDLNLWEVKTPFLNGLVHGGFLGRSFSTVQRHRQALDRPSLAHGQVCLAHLVLTYSIFF